MDEISIGIADKNISFWNYEEMESFGIDEGTIKGAVNGGGTNPRAQDINADR